MIDLARLDLDSLAKSWRAAKPFAHVAIDQLLGERNLEQLRNAIPREPHWPVRNEIYEVLAATEPSQPELRAFIDEIGSAEAREAVRAITGLATTRADGDSYIYLGGSFLLPHTDARSGIDRRVAYVYYLSDDDAFTGGELDLYSCGLDERGEIVSTAVAATLPPKKDRLLLFEVTPTSLHRVREVRSGARVSIAGWFY